MFRKDSVIFKEISAYLLPLSFLYLLFIYLKKIFTHEKDYGFPVISIGNIVAGGTGKTPLLMEIVRVLNNAGKNVVVASSGFRDETFMVARNFPCVKFIRKRKLEFEGLKGFSGVVVLDDGFHCRWIKKSLNILVIDASNPFDNGLLIPSGLLREPKRCLKEADIFIVTRTYMVHRSGLEKIYRYLEKFGKVIYVMDYEIDKLQGKNMDMTTDVLSNSNIIAFTGIGSPMNFFALLSKMNPLKIIGIIYPDHFYYRKKDIDELCNFVLQGKRDYYLLTTEKDFVKLEKEWPCGPPLFYARLKAVLKETSGEKIGFDRLFTPMLK